MEKELFDQLVLAHQTYPECQAPLWALSGHTQTLVGYLADHPQVQSYDYYEKIPTLDGEYLWAGFTKGNKPIVVSIIHGLGGDVNSFFVQRAMRVGKKLGFHCMAVNQRGAGEGVQLSKQLYHSCRWDDLQSISQFVREKFPNYFHVMLSISMSGNMTLQWLGTYKDVAAPDLAMVFNAPLRLEKTSKSLQQGLNKIYDLHFVKGFHEVIQQRRKMGHIEKNFKFPKFNNVYEFDDIWTAPQHGYASAKAYYEASSSFNNLAKIQAPVLVLTSEKDPFVDANDYREATWGPRCSVRIEKQGGHGCYLQRKKNFFGDHFWSDDYLLKVLSTISS